MPVRDALRPPDNSRSARRDLAGDARGAKKAPAVSEPAMTKFMESILFLAEQPHEALVGPISTRQTGDRNCVTPATGFGQAGPIEPFAPKLVLAVTGVALPCRSATGPGTQVLIRP
jgi:hypothetical protein